MEEGFALVLYHGEMKRYQLIESGDLTEEQYTEILETILFKRARERALYYLKSSDKTELDVRKKLRETCYPEPAIDYAVNFLKEYHYIDDTHYGKRYTETHSNKKSKRQIQFELHQKGLSRELVSSILEDYPAEEIPIQKYLDKKHYDRASATPGEKSKLAAALGRKGFSFEIIRKVMGDDFMD